jgi:hypothetical protein
MIMLSKRDSLLRLSYGRRKHSGHAPRRRERAVLMAAFAAVVATCLGAFDTTLAATWPLLPAGIIGGWQGTTGTG